MPIMTPTEIRQAMAALRRLTTLEDTLLELAARETRTPNHLTHIDGFPAGGNTEGRSSDRTSITERSALNLLEHTLNDNSHDPIGERIIPTLFTLENIAASARRAHRLITEAAQISAYRLPAAHTAEVCCEEGCDELAVPGRKGRCEPDYRWLYNHPDVASVPRDVIERRNTRPRRQHETGPLAVTDPVIDRLVADYEETA